MQSALDTFRAEREAADQVHARLTEVAQAREKAEEIYSVHYACQGWDLPLIAPAEVSAIGFKNLVSDESAVYSRLDRPTDQEKYVLDSYFRFLREHAALRRKDERS